MFIVVNQIVPKLVGFCSFATNERLLNILYTGSKFAFSSSVEVISKIFLVREGVEADERIPSEFLLPIVFHLLP